MQSTLIDAGPLIALFDSSDSYHKRAVAFLKNSQGSFITTWPVITEVSHMLDFSIKTQINLNLYRCVIFQNNFNVDKIKKKNTTLF